MASKVRIYRSTDVGAPVLSGTIGSLIPVLDACLVNGITAQSVTGITRSGTTATATITAHGFRNGDTVTIAGATQTDYNITATISNVSANTFDYTVANSPATPATGTITAKKTGAGWTKAFSGTNLAAYLQGSGPAGYLAVDDTTAQYASVRGYETMSAVATGTGQFPTSAQVATSAWFKSTAASSTAVPWIIFATDTLIHIWVGLPQSVAAPAVSYFFGQYISYKAGDIYNNAIAISASATVSSANASPWTSMSTSVSAASTNVYLDRSYTQLGTASTAGLHSDYVKARSGSYSNGSSNGLAYPNTPDNGLYVAPVWVHEPIATPVLRGVLPGIWYVLHTQVLTHGDTWSGTGDLAGKTFELVDFYNNSSSRCSWAYETSDTWGI